MILFYTSDTSALGVVVVVYVLKIVSRVKILRFENSFFFIIIFVLVDLCFSWLFVAKQLLLLVFTVGVGVVCCSGMIPHDFLQGCGLHLLLYTLDLYRCGEMVARTTFSSNIS